MLRYANRFMAPVGIIFAIVLLKITMALGLTVLKVATYIALVLALAFIFGLV